jgi:hypothetical protein
MAISSCEARARISMRRTGSGFARFHRAGTDNTVMQRSSTLASSGEVSTFVVT